MGGRGSGAPRVYAGVIEDRPRIDVTDLRRKGALRTGDHEKPVTGEFHWRRGDRDEGAAFLVESGDDGVPRRILLNYKVNGRSMDYPVDLTTTRPYFGGHRFWFRCPLCRRRCMKLYLTGWHFVCRLCSLLVHRSTRQVVRDRLRDQARKIEARLDEGGKKPKRMRWRTYGRLVRRAEGYRSAAWRELLNLKRIGNFEQGAASEGPRELLTQDEAVVILRLDQMGLKNPKETLRHLRRTKQLGYVKVAGKVLIPRDEVEAYLRGHTVHGNCDGTRG